MPRAVLTVGMIAALVAGGGGAVAAGQPSTTPAAPTTSVTPQQAPPPADPCATTTAPTTTTTTTTGPPTATSAAPAACTTIPTAPATSSAPAPAASAPTSEPAPELSPAQLPAEPAVVEPVTPTDPALSSKTAEPDPDWTPTEDPNATIVPGDMRSDREEIPAPFTKEDADKAETMEARQRVSRAAVGCQTYWPSPYEVCGVIRDKYNSLGGPASFLSFPYSPEYTSNDGVGKRSLFLNGPIYWSPAGGAHPVVNSFLNRWGVHRYEEGFLKYPTTDEIVLPDGGRRQEFQQGAIYVAFQNAIGSAIANGPLRDKYNSVGGLAPGGTLLGYLTEDHNRALPDGQGQMARFQNGVIYWHPTYGAHPVVGGVLTQWSASGYETGQFGYPIRDEHVYTPVNSDQQFQHGVIASPRRIDETYCGDICTDAIYRAFPQLRANISAPQTNPQTPCSALPPDSGTALCEPDTSAQRRAPEPTVIQPANSAIQDFCYNFSPGVWNTEAHYSCGYKNVSGVLRLPRTATDVGTIAYTLEHEERLSPNDLFENELRTNIIVKEASKQAVGARVTVTPTCVGGGGCKIFPASRTATVGGVGSNILFDFDVHVNTPSTAEGGGLSTPIISFDQAWTPGAGEEWIPGTLGDVRSATMRCDNYDYLSYAGAGCVFAEATSAVDFGPSKNLPEIAWHTIQAQESGLPGRNTPLHRATPAETAATEKIACVGPRYPSPRPAGKECDEYPYKSSFEGAQFAPSPRTFNPPCGLKQIFDSVGNAGFSVCLVDASQNSSQGSVLRQFYGQYRIRYGDPYQVYASGGTAPVPAEGWDN
jgi:hypothetical protein